MANVNKHELWRELEATDEAFVRQKFATGGYGPAKGTLVARWIAANDAHRQAEHDAAEIRAAITTAFWTKVTAIISAIAVVISIVVASLPRTQSVTETTKSDPTKAGEIPKKMSQL